MTRTSFHWLCIALTILVSGCGMTRVPPTAQSAQTAPPAEMPSPPPLAPAPPSLPSPPRVSHEQPLAAAPAPPKAKDPSKPRVASAAPPAHAAPAAPKAPQVAAPPSLDLKQLERRLKETNAVGVLTKLSLKNQVDDLVQRFRAFHEGQRPPTLADLRPSFDLLLMKVLSLLQDKDPTLARDIDVSRNALWGVLTDREKLASY